MKITEVKITGFKSFVDGIILPISSGLTGIVGPNGCGKSNVLEALRWVMGATSAKALRGGEMDDVIFQGTEQRPSRDIAEVILKIDNSAGLAPTPFKNTPILEISRKIRRGQGSTFRINGKEVRAKDVQLMFADASSGANSPALVRQGQVSELINARPENRRKVLEEAAGISGLQSRRHDAQFKLNGTETNLERIGEIIIHMEDQISSLKKQAIRTQKYRNLQAQIRGLEMYIAHQKYLGLEKHKIEIESSLKEAINQSNILMVEFNRAEREVAQCEENLKPLLEEQAIADAILRRLEAKKFEFDRDLSEVSNNLENANNIRARLIKDIERENEIFADANNALLELSQEIENLSLQENNEAEILNYEKNIQEINEKIKSKEIIINNISNQKANLNAQFQSNLRNKQQLEQQILQITQKINNKNDLIAELKKSICENNIQDLLQDNILKAQEKLNDFSTKMNNLENQIQNLEKNEDEARKSLQGQNNRFNSLKSELRGLEALNQTKNNISNNKAIDVIKVTSGYEKALSVALGDDLNGEIGTSNNNHWQGAKIHEISWPKNIEFAILCDFVNAPIELLSRLKAVAIVSDDDFEKIDELPLGLRIVTKSGRLKRWDGFVITGNKDLSAAIRFEQLNRITELKQEIAIIEPQIKSQELDFSQLRNQLLALREELRKLRPNGNILNHTLLQSHQELANFEAKIKNIKNNIELQSQEIQNLQTSLEEIKTQTNQFGQIDEVKFKDEISKFDLELVKHNDEIKSLKEQSNQIAVSLLNLKNGFDEKVKKLENAKNSQRNWQNREKSSNIRIKELKTELENISKSLEDLKQKPAEIEALRQKAIGEMPKIESRKKLSDDNLANAQSKLREAILLCRNKENHLNAAKEAINTAQILNQTWIDRTQELESEILQNFSHSVFDLPRIYEPQLNDIKNLNIEKAQSRLSRALEEREDIGNVNLRADIELDEQNKRLSTLSKERNDLLAAVKKLKLAIEEINAEGKERLLKAFDIVNNHFIDLFTTLFEGGAAHLALTENEDPLGGGLEVYACPPGKRLSSMSLMSGGEQALTATALIFAVFLSNPAPISVLDELDAPLDDANVDRFCKLLDEMRKRTDTRFICITHHPITMASMDRLFGVTMAERGVSNVVSVDLSRAQSMIDA